MSKERLTQEARGADACLEGSRLAEAVSLVSLSETDAVLYAQKTDSLKAGSEASLAPDAMEWLFGLQSLLA